MDAPFIKGKRVLPAAQDRTRINDQIKAPTVRLIDHLGNNMDAMPTSEARRIAETANLDLVEVAPDARPPVCRIMDYGKYKYKKKKRKTESRKKSANVQLKELRLRPKIEEHDRNIKVKQARVFLEQGHKVQLNLLFRGREFAFKDRGQELLVSFSKELEDLAKVEQMPRLEGKRMNMVLTPIKR